ncbi:MAG: SLBB domain-containing protein [Terracidiphilus sp.]
MSESDAVSYTSPGDSRSRAGAPTGSAPQIATRTLRDLAEVIFRRRRFVGGVVGGLLFACLLYCLIAPNEYEAAASVELRSAPVSPLSQGISGGGSAAQSSDPFELETLASVFRSDQLAWEVIAGLKLYQAKGFMGDFARRFPNYRPEAPSAEAQAWLIERFHERLHVETLPHTLLIRIRFRSHDAALSAAVVNALIHAYQRQNSEERMDATAKASLWLKEQLKDLKAQVDRDQQRMAAFQQEHGLLTVPETLANGSPAETQHAAALLEIDALSRQLVEATSDRILREAEYRAAREGNPEMVIASDPQLAADNGDFDTAVLRQIHARQSELEQEQARLNIEEGPNFPRVVEVRRLLENLAQQERSEDARLVERFRGAWKTAADREQLLRGNLALLTGEGLKTNQAAAQYATMSAETNASEALYVRMLEKVEEAGLDAGVEGSSISVVDPARQPVKPVTPDPPLDLGITLFVALWLAIGGALLMESIRFSSSSAVVRAVVLLLAAALTGFLCHAQAPTPSTSGLPTGVVRLPPSQRVENLPNPKQAPEIWNQPEAEGATEVSPSGVPLSSMLAPIGPGDLLDVSEYHIPQFHTQVRVSAAGTIDLPLIHEVKVSGLDEQGAARVIEAALIAQGMLLHPQVSVLVLVSVGQDVDVLGEVTRPGVYSYTMHHRLLDLISEASGLTPSAGRLVNIFHRDDSMPPRTVALDPEGAYTAADHNPELDPGDTVEVSRAGLIYVVGDVLRPGGFPVDPVHGLTVVQALALAWGPTENASLGKAILIREQKGGRTLTSLNLKRLMRGQDLDQPVRDGDILYVPDSAAKNIWNKTMQSAIESAVGVTIYGGLVYSQWFNRSPSTITSPATPSAQPAVRAPMNR